MSKPIRRVSIICKYCENTFEVKPHLSQLGKHNYRIFCSSDCYHKSRKGIKREFTKEWKEKIIKNGKDRKGKKNPKISISLKNSEKAGESNPAFGKGELQRGKLNPANNYGLKNWKGGITKTNQILRNGSAYVNWRDSVFSRDNYICQECKSRNGNSKEIYLQAHHLKSVSDYPELILDIDNGITLCLNCHEKIHNKHIGIKPKEKQT